MHYKAFHKQALFHNNLSRIRGAGAGKRGGKTEAGAIEAIRFAETQPGYVDNGIDPYLGIIIAPTDDMLKRLSLQKFQAYGKSYIVYQRQKPPEMHWHNGSVIYGISADKPQRLEGVKAGFIWIDEVFQCPEQIFLEAVARVSDTEGFIWVTGSLGTQYNNPKNHWVYKHFIEKPLEGSWWVEWPTVENPHFPRNELTRLQNTLDPRTYRQMFTIDWQVPGTALVYGDLEEANIGNYQYNKDLPVTVCIDWGWAHPCACLFFQYDPNTDTVYLIDEIVESKLKLNKLYNRIMAKPYKIRDWVCDVAGNQEREMLGKSNIKWFEEKGITFKYRRTAINYGIPIVRSYILDGKGRRKFLINKTCTKTIDCLYNYSYPQKDGIITDENPVKKEDDAADSVRYYFVNIIDRLNEGQRFRELNRWQTISFNH